MTHNIFQLSHSIDVNDEDNLYKFSIFIHNKFPDLFHLHSNAWLLKVPSNITPNDIKNIIAREFGLDANVPFFISKLSLNKADYDGIIYMNVWDFINQVINENNIANHENK